MFKPILKWTIILAALLVVGPVAGRLAGSMRSASGDWDTTALLSGSIPVSLIKMVVVLAMAGAMGVLASVLFGSRTGLTVAGLALGWAAWSTGTLDVLVAQSPSRQPKPILTRLAIEAVLAGAAGLAVVYAILRVGVRVDERMVQPRPAGPRRPPDTGVMLTAFISAAALAGLAVWWIAFQPLKGQAIFAVIVGSIAAAAAAHLAAPQLPSRTTALIAFAALALLGVAGPLSAMFMGPAGPGLRAIVAGAVSHLAYPNGMDWLAGAFLGVPIGLSWSGSMVDRHSPKPATA